MATNAHRTLYTTTFLHVSGRFRNGQATAPPARSSRPSRAAAPAAPSRAKKRSAAAAAVESQQSEASSVGGRAGGKRRRLPTWETGSTGGSSRRGRRRDDDDVSQFKRCCCCCACLFFLFCDYVGNFAHHAVPFVLCLCFVDVGRWSCPVSQEHSIGQMRHSTHCTLQHFPPTCNRFYCWNTLCALEFGNIRNSANSRLSELRISSEL